MPMAARMFNRTSATTGLDGRILFRVGTYWASNPMVLTLKAIIIAVAA